MRTAYRMRLVFSINIAEIVFHLGDVCVAMCKEQPKEILEDERKKAQRKRQRMEYKYHRRWAILDY